MADERIEIDPKIMSGKPVIRGTRIPVELIVRKLSEGAQEDDLLEAYPHLSREDVRAALAHAADAISGTRRHARRVSLADLLSRMPADYQVEELKW